MAANELAALRVEITSNVKAVAAEVTQLRAQLAELEAQAARGGGVGAAVPAAAIARIKEAGKGVRGITSAFTGVTATAGAAAGAILSVANAVDEIINFFEALDGTATANKFISTLKIDGENAAKSLEMLRERIIEVEGELGALNASPNNPFGRYRKAIEGDLERLREMDRSLSKQVEKHKRNEEAAKKAEEAAKKAEEAKAKQAELEGKLLDEQREAEQIRRDMGSDSDRVNAETDDKIDYLKKLQEESDDEAFDREIDRIRAIHEERRRLMLEEIKERDEEERRLAADRAAENARDVAESLKRAIADANREGDRHLANIQASGSRLEALLQLIAVNTGR